MQICTALSVYEHVLYTCRNKLRLFSLLLWFLGCNGYEKLCYEWHVNSLVSGNWAKKLREELLKKKGLGRM
jgi:hypothetical protein